MTIVSLLIGHNLDCASILLFCKVNSTAHNTAGINTAILRAICDNKLPVSLSTRSGKPTGRYVEVEYLNMITRQD